MMAKLQPEQIELIAKEQVKKESGDWHSFEEEQERRSISDRVSQRVRTVMRVENMSPHQRAEYIIQMEDEKEQMMEMIRQLQIDPLTGLNTRRFYEESFPRIIEDRIKQAKIVQELSEFKEGFEEESPEITMLMVDADHFKNINDTYGHAGGDFVLRELGKIINQVFRKRDIKARYGGEELAIIMPGCDLKTAREKAEILRQTVENHEFVFHPQGGMPITIEPVRVSIGVGGLSLTEEKGDASQLKALLEKRSDALVYAAKDLGRNTVVSQDAVDLESVYQRKELGKSTTSNVQVVTQKDENGSVAEAS